MPGPRQPDGRDRTIRDENLTGPDQTAHDDIDPTLAEASSEPDDDQTVGMVPIESDTEQTVVEQPACDETMADPAGGWGAGPVPLDRPTDATVIEPQPDVDDQTMRMTDDEDDNTLRTMVASISDAASSAASPVQHLERFELERILGQGAFGTVYLARDPRLDRRVAIKVARTGVLQSKSDIDRFTREACAAAQLRHPNIVPVYEVGQVRGTTYIVYEYVEGNTLKGLLRSRGRLEPEHAVDLMIKIAEALDYAHSHGIVHRDMKPDNVLIDAAGEPHIADFGLARREEQDATQTREGTLMGTPAYMSPEQASGQISRVDKQSDVWSLGIMLDEMLTSRRPFSGTVVEVLRAVQEQTIKPLRTVDPSLPVDLETICLKALEREKESRFETAGQMAAELTRWRRGEPISLRRISPVERLWRWAKRNQVVAALLATLLVTLTLGTAISTWFGIDASRTATALRQSRDDRVREQLRSVLTAQPGAVSTLLNEVVRRKQDTPGLLDSAREATADDTRPARRALLIRRLAAPTSPDHTAALRNLSEHLLQTKDPSEFLLLREELKDDRSTLVPGLWAALRDENAEDGVRLRAACALALYEPESERWDEVNDAVVSRLLADRLTLTYWVTALQPVKEHLKDSLQRVFDNKDDTNRQAAAAVLGALYGDEPELMAALVSRAEPDQLGELTRQFATTADAASALARPLDQAYPESLADEQLDAVDRQRANHVIALLEAGQFRRANRELRTPDRNGVRSHVIDRVGSARLRKQVLFRYLREESNPRLLRTAILSLAGFGEADIDRREKQDRLEDLMRLYRSHPDSGVHAATEWLVRRWGFADEINEEARKLRSPNWPTDDRNWHHTPSGIVFAIFRNPVPFWMGTEDPNRGELFPDETPHEREIGRSFAVSLHEITIAQYQQFDPEYKPLSKLATGEHPVTRVRWYEAAKFCRWLSEQEQLETCYEPGQSEQSVRVLNINERNGYRLPTSAEWEYASRAGTRTSRHYGSGTMLLSSYAWTASSAETDLQPVGVLLPNEFGLFDTLGNVSEWCQNWYDEGPPAGSDVIDGDESKADSYVYREFRPTSIDEVAVDTMDGARGSGGPPTGPLAIISNSLGFRIARTVPE